MNIRISEYQKRQQKYQNIKTKFHSTKRQQKYQNVKNVAFFRNFSFHSRQFFLLRIIEMGEIL
eukprot:UN02303